MREEVSGSLIGGPVFLMEFARRALFSEENFATVTAEKC
jgi:hypothetical protein